MWTAEKACRSHQLVDIGHSLVPIAGHIHSPTAYRWQEDAVPSLESLSTESGKRASLRACGRSRAAVFSSTLAESSVSISPKRVRSRLERAIWAAERSVRYCGRSCRSFATRLDAQAVSRPCPICSGGSCEGVFRQREPRSCAQRRNACFTEGTSHVWMCSTEAKIRGCNAIVGSAFADGIMSGVLRPVSTPYRGAGARTMFPLRFIEHNYYALSPRSNLCVHKGF